MVSSPGFVSPAASVLDTFLVDVGPAPAVESGERVVVVVVVEEEDVDVELLVSGKEAPGPMILAS